MERYFLVGVFLTGKMCISGGTMEKLIFNRFPSEKDIVTELKKRIKKKHPFSITVISITEVTKEEFENF